MFSMVLDLFSYRLLMNTREVKTKYLLGIFCILDRNDTISILINVAILFLSRRNKIPIFNGRGLMARKFGVKGCVIAGTHCVKYTIRIAGKRLFLLIRMVKCFNFISILLTI